METKRKNFTETEKHLLMSLVGKYITIIENKSTKQLYVDRKKETWNTITQNFNASAESGPRSAKQLKILYENLKRDIRKNVVSEHQEKYLLKLEAVKAAKSAAVDFKQDIFKTGGGPLSCSISNEQELLLAELQGQIQPLENMFDSAAEYMIPVSLVTAEEAGESPEIPEELILDDDDSTTHNLERLVSAATCLVAGVEYTHGQQIYRANQCEFCLCLDGEMFCWWQECPPESEGPCKDRRPFTPCENPLDNHLEHPYPALKIPTTRPTFPSTQGHRTSTDMTSTSSGNDLEDTWSTMDNSSIAEEPTDTTFVEETTAESERTSGTTGPSVCVVMGTTYKIGEMLPHATGNCLECICGAGARVTCSPHLCAPPGDDSADYRPPGPF